MDKTIEEKRICNYASPNDNKQNNSSCRKKLFENFNITSLEPTDLSSVKVSKKFVLTNKKM